MDDLADRRAAFFSYWRGRVDFIETLRQPERHHEANVLLLASMDALAMLWQLAFARTDLRTHARRFGQFLVECDTEHADTLDRISIPYVRWRASEQPPKFSAPLVQALQSLRQPPRPSDPYSLEARQARLTSNDPKVHELLSGDLAAFSGATTTRGQTLGDWLLDSRFAEIVYREYRCSWLHEGRAGEATHSFENNAIEATYLTNDYATPPRIQFSIPFLVAILRSAIDGFEKATESSNVDPVPPAHMQALDLPLEDDTDGNVATRGGT